MYRIIRKRGSSVEDELLRCEEFQISVAFITMGGVTLLLQTLKELEEKGIKGQILTTNYLDFSEPRALEKLNGLKNITLKMYDVEAAGNGFHTKGYIFKKEEIYRIIIGSSNMTSAALTVNKEWNTKLISTENGEGAEEIVEEFQKLWNSEYALPYDDFYEVYKERYNIIKHQREIAKSEERALLISATGVWVILMTGRKVLIYKGFRPVFSIMGNKKLIKKVIDKLNHNDLSLDNAMRQMVVR
ncbi:phospholipase D-like domain-containing protein [Blautia wexlerae]|nr:phospholipase D-like domain-containing protein [Blautia wexlerae]